MNIEIGDLFRSVYREQIIALVVDKDDAYVYYEINGAYLMNHATHFQFSMDYKQIS